MPQNADQGAPEERLFALIAEVAGGTRGHWCDDARSLVAEIRYETRQEIADDVHQAEPPQFAESERPDLVVKTTRAIDVRLIDKGRGAPYYVAPEGRV